ncbi:MAG: bifunctional (p)ppGpp synthetase/guanosine-3',5'-bis(diphosphate) 3'-pyrophosphohydrolase, partial [Thermodesulfobacteriota bacterium]
RGLSVHRKGCNRLASLKFSREDVVTVRWNLKKTAVEMEQSLLLLRAPRNRFLMMLGAAPAQVQILAIDLLTTHGGQIGDWEVRFRVDNLFELRVFLLHCSNTGLPYEYGIER